MILYVKDYVHLAGDRRFHWTQFRSPASFTSNGFRITRANRENEEIWAFENGTGVQRALDQLGAQTSVSLQVLPIRLAGWKRGTVRSGDVVGPATAGATGESGWGGLGSSR